MKIFNGLKYTDNFASCLGFVDKELEEISFHKTATILFPRKVINLCRDIQIFLNYFIFPSSFS